MRSFTAVVNPAAGGSGTASGAAAVIPLARLLRESGAQVVVEHSAGLEHARALARAAAERGDVVLGVGGDGMIGSVGGALARTGAVFGIVPAGRGNDFARQLGVPADPAELADLLLHAEPRPVDVIMANGTAVLGSVYAGVDAVAGRNANESRLLRGSAAYYVGALRAVAGWRPAAYRVTVDGAPHERRGYTVVTANSGFYGFGRHIAPDARVDDGLLDVVIIRHAPKPLFFAVMRELADGSHVGRPQVEVLRGREVRVEADRDLPYGADGETAGALPVTATVVPGALNVLRP
ncbi:diacylglycerol/lipid kinase family protein [Actinomadura alba]|uniref:Diacylglycerol kinase family lipid kinase n=1 Tax=Actinomadura alba TaxID=406431 RepID=A0ABR7M0N9_9ACTN|nr:YegS/Rv2252/BmrU family lipid kinase [Actinomadura alba]MBC6470305.1 diacylglycerol kinase family lipid kinase [Actinomadura alba]